MKSYNRNRIKVMNVATCVAAVAFCLAALAVPQARASYLLGDAGYYGMLYEGNGGNTLSYNNSLFTGEIGIGNTGKFQGNNPGTITGNLDFSASNSGQFSQGGLTISGTEHYNVSNVTSALSTANSLSQTLGLEPGTDTTISSGGTLFASSGSLDASGNRVFTVTSINFSSGTCTIDGGENDFVVLNIAGGVGNNGLNGSIALAGGITSDQVLFNYTPSISNSATYNSDYASLSGGPTMTISTNGLATTGVFLDPTGNFQVNHTGVISGRIIGGDTQNSSFVSGAELIAPPDNPGGGVPEPSTLALFAVGTIGLLTCAWRRRTRRVATL